MTGVQTCALPISVDYLYVRAQKRHVLQAFTECLRGTCPQLIGAGTKVLGPVYIGDNARIGAGSVVLCNLPANCTAVGVPAEVVRINNKAVNPADDLDQQDLPDVVAQRIRDLDRRIGVLEKAAQGDTPPTASQIAARQKP